MCYSFDVTPAQILYVQNRNCTYKSLVRFCDLKPPKSQMLILIYEIQKLNLEEMQNIRFWNQSNTKLLFPHSRNLKQQRQIFRFAPGL